ncbi:hypothetical protein AJ78_03721 [Emergomyces pasteurianus Ep9510]|uniref:RNA polymerase II subunit B1 CTD phosphatase RPAP2 homolog n=1 Tax=Emergomyces pasteurianus Ep9510 TaxID=1447872 RepID=A0A1J9PI04_9EURO|nr:hypothetical protein AJ78_03721 [Emergomyces pasteurianus Ep9510]
MSDPVSPRQSSPMKSSLPSIHAALTGQTSPPPNTKSSRTSTTTTTTKPTTGPKTISKQRKAPDPRHLAIALHHANQIQARKDTEALILSRIEELISFPSSPIAQASSPIPADAKAFKEALIPFQPSDYDNLILERNIDGRCGYVLCANEHRKEDPKAKFRVVWGKKGSGPGGRGKEMKVVPKEQIERWCSDECAERAMYIRVQLIEQPAWERGTVGRQQAEQLLLLEEGRARRERNRLKGKEVALQEEQVKEANDVEEAMRRLVISDKSLEPEAIVDEMGQLAVRDDDGDAGQAILAIERGDRAPHPRLYGDRVGVNIFEKQFGSSPEAAGGVQAPSLRTEDLYGGSIEGFEPTRQLGKARHDDDEEDDDDILPTI